MDLPAPRPASPSSFADLYHLHIGRVWTALARLGVAPSDLEDAVQDVFLVAHRRRASLSPESSMRAWLLGICRRVASDHRRRDRRHRRRLDGLRRHAPGEVDPEEVLARREGARHLQAFLDTLEPSKREIFVMVELEQLTGSEAARLLGVNRNTAAARLRAARSALERYAHRVRRRPEQLVDRARDEHERPDAATRRRLSSALVLKIGNVPAPTGAGSMLLGLKSAALSLGLAGIGLGGLHLGAERWHAVRSSTRFEPPAHAAHAPANASRDVEPTVTAGERDPDPATEVPTPVSLDATERSMPDHGAPRLPSVSPRMADASPASSTPAPPSLDPLEAQNRALRRARAALRDGRPSTALALVDATILQHPSGVLVPELTLARIDALCARGRRAQARGEAAVFRRVHASSPLAERARCPRPEQ